MSDKKQWDNLSTVKSKSSSTYGLTTNPSAVSFVKVHEIAHSHQYMSKQILIFVTMSTFDSEFVVLQNEYQTGKFNGKHLQVVQKLRFRTHYPIANCWLEFQYHQKNGKDCLFGTFIDIFSNLYSLNLTTYIEYNIKIPGKLQPIKYTPLYTNLNFSILNRPNLVYLQHPMLLTQYQGIFITVNLGGTIRMFDTKRQRSLIQTQLEPHTHQLPNLCLAASCNKNRTTYGHVVVMVINNKQLPYIFINLTNDKQYAQQIRLLDKYYKEGDESALEITFCDFDCTTNLIAVSTVSQQIQLYEIRRGRDGDSPFYFCQKIFRFFPQKSGIYLELNIESISTNKGFLAITTCKEYILFNLVQRVITKRGKGSKEKNQIEKLKWTQVIDRHNDYLALLLIKGYNHLNQAQSKLGKPNLHFKTCDIAGRKRIM